MSINASTVLCAIIGNPVRHSLSPIMHNAAFGDLGLNYCYVAFEVTSVSDAITGMRALNIRGFSVTIPHKLEVMKYLDEIDDVAQCIGAVNTIVNSSGKLKGYNTDWQGLVRSIEEHTTLAGKRIALLGAGGAARAAAFGIQRQGGLITIFNRSQEKAQQLATEVGCECGELAQGERIAAADIVVNATSVGMHPQADSLIINPSYLRSGQIVKDMVYNPLNTRLLQEAKARGCVVIHGSEMLVLQGAAQFELWTGQAAPVELMRSTLLKHLADK